MILGIVLVAVLAILYVVLDQVHKAYRMRLVTCVIRPEQLGDVTSALLQNHLGMGMTVINVRGFGRQRGDNDQAESAEDKLIRFLPKVKLEILVKSRDVRQTMDVIGGAVRTGNIGDGKIIVLEAVAAMRIRTGETGIDAL